MQNRRKVPLKPHGLFRRWHRVMAELQVSATVLSWHSDAPGDSWLNFFLGLSPKETWIPGGMKRNLISPSYPPSCSAVNLPADPSACPGSASLPCDCNSPLCFCWGPLSCKAKPSGDILVFTGCPGSSRCTPLLSHTCVLAQGAYVKLAPDSARKWQSHSLEKLPWGEGIGRFPLWRDSSENRFFLPCPGWGGSIPAPLPRAEPPQLPLVIPPCPCSAGGPAQPPEPSTISSCHGLRKRFRASTGSSQPALTPGLCCLSVLFFAPSNFCLGRGGGH